MNLTERIEDPVAAGLSKRFQEFFTSPLTARVERLRDTALNLAPTGEITWDRIYTRVYRETEGEPMIVRRAKIFAALCREYPVSINDDSLLAGYLFESEHAVPLCVSQHGGGFPLKPPLTPEQEAEYAAEIEPYWAGADGRFLKTRYGQTYARFTDEQKNLFFQDPHAYPQQCTFIADADYLRVPHVAHTEALHEKILAVGLRGFIDDAQAKIASFDFADPQTDPRDHQKVRFLQSVIVGLEAACEVGPRIARMLWDKASHESDPQRRKELLQMAEINARVPANPPETFWEALQCLWSVHFLQWWETPMIGGMSHGRVDQYLWRFYQRDLAAGRITRESAQELIDCFCCKLGTSLGMLGANTEGSLWAGAPIGHHVDLGGMKPEDGSDATNELSYLFLEAAGRLRLAHPNYSVLLHHGTPDEFLRRATELVSLGLTHPYFFNTEAMTELALNRAAALGGPPVPLSMARNCGIIGCSEHTMRGYDGGYIGAGHCGVPHLLEFVLNRGSSRLFQRQMSIDTGNPLEFESFDELLAALEKQMRHVFGLMSSGFDVDELVLAEMEPTVFQSAIIGDCIDKGLPREEGGARYNHGSPIGLTGCVDLGNALAAIKKLVFEDQTLTMAELCDALAANFQGFDEIRQRCLNAPKFGNGGEYVEELVAWVMDISNEIVRQYGNPRGGKKYTFQIPLQHSVLTGMTLGAMPSGRVANYPVSDGCGPTHGSDVSGPFAVLKSVGRTSPTDVLGGNVLNMRLEPDMFDAEDGYQQTMALLRAFVDERLTEIQFNVLSNETMRAAQEVPEEYKGLIVRVTGYSAYFTQLLRPFQDAIINRTEHRFFDACGATAGDSSATPTPE